MRTHEDFSPAKSLSNKTTCRSLLIIVQLTWDVGDKTWLQEARVLPPDLPQDCSQRKGHQDTLYQRRGRERAKEIWKSSEGHEGATQPWASSVLLTYTPGSPDWLPFLCYLWLVRGLLQHSAQEHGFRSRGPAFSSEPCPLSSHVALDKSCNLPGPQFPHLCIRDKTSSYFIGLLWGLRVVYINLLEQYSEPRKHYMSCRVPEKKAMGLSSGFQDPSPRAINCCCVTFS